LCRRIKKLVIKYHDCSSKINIPTLIIWGDNDNIVPKQSIEYLEKSIKVNKKIIYVKNSTHNLFKEDIENKLSKEIIKFFKYKFRYDFNTKNID